MSEILVFGNKELHLDYKTRVGVYAVIFNERMDQVLVIRTVRGGFFLPGGGIEVEENHSECLKREMLEETGFEVRIGEYLGQAKKYHLVKGKLPTLSHAHFYLATLGERRQEPVEKDEAPIWVNIGEVESLLFHEHQVWGVKQALLNY
jgi:8-oxo-dGTP diphosphatase